MIAARLERIEANLLGLGALKFARSFCRREGATLAEVSAYSGPGGSQRGRDPRIVRARHRLWTVLSDTLGLSCVACATIFEVNHVTVLQAVRKRRLEIESGK